MNYFPQMIHKEGTFAPSSNTVSAPNPHAIYDSNYQPRISLLRTHSDSAVAVAGGGTFQVAATLQTRLPLRKHRSASSACRSR